MRILFIGINYWPEQTGIAPFTTGRCEFLAERGHQVTILTTLPYYPQWRVTPEYQRALLAREMRNGVTILRTRVYVPRRVTSAKRACHEASFVAFAILRAAMQHISKPPDLLFVVSPPLGLGMVAAILNRIWRVPYVFHVADLQPDTALDLGMLRSGRLAQALYGIERIAYRNAALVSTVAEGMRSRIISKGVPAEKVALFSDWANPGLFADPPGDSVKAFRHALGVGDSLLVVHAGNMGVKQGLEVVLEAARLCDSPAIAIRLVGDGAARPSLEKRAGQIGLRNVKFLPLLPGDSFRTLLAAADVCLVTQQKSVADIVFPSKLISLLAAGKPVIASVNRNSEVARTLENAGAGLIIEPENPRVLRNAIVALHADPGLRREMARRGRAHALQRWNCNLILPAMEAELSRPAAESAKLRVVSDRVPDRIPDASPAFPIVPGCSCQPSPHCLTSGTVHRLMHRFYDRSRGWVDGTSQFAAMIAKRLRAGAYVLDLGAGRGNGGPVNFSDTGSRVVGIDFDPLIVDNKRLHYRILGKAERMPFRSNSFDLVYCDWVTEHLEEPSATAREVLRVLKPGGAFLFRTGNRHHYTVAIAAHTPHWFHSAVANRVRRLSKESVEPYPTYYRMNTLRDVRNCMANAGFEEEELLTVEAEPSYMVFSLPAFLLGVAYERLVNRLEALGEFRACLLGCFRKPRSSSAHVHMTQEVAAVPEQAQLSAF